MRKTLYSDFHAAMIGRNITKGDLMTMCYGKNYRGIDSAIPQDVFDTLGLSYGNADIERDAFYFVTDCTTSLYKVVDMRTNISDAIAHIIIRHYKQYTNLLVKSYDDSDYASQLAAYVRVSAMIQRFQDWRSMSD